MHVGVSMKMLDLSIKLQTGFSGVVFSWCEMWPALAAGKQFAHLESILYLSSAFCLSNSGLSFSLSKPADRGIFLPPSFQMLT